MSNLFYNALRVFVVFYNLILLTVDNILQYLSKILGVPKENVLKCSQFYTFKKVKKGNFLLREGEICKDIFFVEKGILRMYSVDKNGKEHIVQFAPENWLISDRSSVFFEENSHYYIDATEDAEVWVLKDEFFTEMQTKYPETNINNKRLLNKHIKNLQDRINSLLSDSAEERYMKFIKMYPDIMLRVPQWMVASYLGITPESLSRVRKELAKKNFRTD